MNKKYYKVVRAAKGKLGSALSCKHSIQYKVRKWTKPKLKYSKLFVFTDLKFARDFKEHQSYRTLAEELVIYECRVKEPISINYISTYSKDDEWFWQAMKDGRPLFTSSRVPIGTMVADEVKLTRKVQ